MYFFPNHGLWTIDYGPQRNLYKYLTNFLEQKLSSSLIFVTSQH